ncbi:MAG: glycosyl hydrolase [Ignavibacteria bacterium]
MKTISKLLFLFLFITGISFSQYKNIKINKHDNAPEEVSISINPVNPLNIVVGANLNNNFYTTDGGENWGNNNISSDDYGVWGDPCIIFDPKGNSYYFHLSSPPEGKFIDRIVCQKSTDEGINFDNPGTFTGLNLPKAQDKAWACPDWTRHNNLYVCWTQFDKYNSRKPDDHSNIMFSCSTDAGSSWSVAKRINETPGDCRDSSNTVEGAVPCTGPEGELYVTWSGPSGIVFNRSTDAGLTWMDKNIFVCDQVGGWDYEIEGIFRCNGMAVTGCDISNGPNRGTIYVNFSDQRNGAGDIDIFLSKSTDGGNTWSKPKRVNDDKFGNNKQQFMGWMSVDPLTGAVNVLFYDRRNYDDTQTDVYLARSTDGGNTFNNIKISESPFTPSKGIFFGDYTGICSYNDFAACVWQRLDKGNLSIMYCGIDFKK